MQKDIEKVAVQLLKEHPEHNVVYVGEDKQAFFNKLASKNHAAQRKIKVFPFYRAGVQQEFEAVETLDEVQEVLEERQAVITAIQKVVEKQDHNITVDVETDPVLASVIELTESLDKVTSEKESLATKVEKLEADIKDLQKQLDTKNTKK